MISIRCLLLPLSAGVLLRILGTPVVVVEAGWRPLASSPSTSTSTTYRASVGRGSPSSSSPSRDDVDVARRSLPSIFGVGNDAERFVRGRRRRRLLASVAAANSVPAVRGGGGDEEDDDDANRSDDDAEEEEEEERIHATNEVADDDEEASENENENENDDGDEERYSRQVYALGARAHGLVRSATVVLDGPLGGAGVANDEDEDDVDPPAPSGLLYEVAKNLALSGVGRVVLVRDDDSDVPADAGYFDGTLDDLGSAYRRAASSEIFGDGDVASADGGALAAGVRGDDDDGAELLAEYVRRLNPGVRVDVVTRAALFRSLANMGADRDADDDDEDDEDAKGVFSDDENDDRADVLDLGANPVVVCVDRSTTAQLETNDACRRAGGGGDVEGDGEDAAVPFVSVETAGVHARLFCDFGPGHVVVDEDGETPRSTLLDRVERNDPPPPREEEEDGASSSGGGSVADGETFTVRCLEGERHDVSMGDVIEFQGEHGGDGGLHRATFPKCKVTSVKSPTCFTAREWQKNGKESNKSDADKADSHEAFSPLLEGKARSFSRVKVPKRVSFSSLRQILRPPSLEKGTAVSNCCEDDSLFAPILDKSFDPVRRNAVMTSAAALDSFVKKYGRLPSGDRGGGPTSERTDEERFRSIVRKMTKQLGGETSATDRERRREMIDQFARTCRAKFVPVQALAGALGAQEALKAATGLYNPVRQFLLYDCDEVLAVGEDPSEGCSDDDAGGELEPPPPRGMSHVLGDRAARELAGTRPFVVGAGAIGCELLKNLAAMGVGTGGGGKGIVLTDMDTIEKSNLSRQLLFRDHDVGEFKSVAARAAVLRFDQDCVVETHTCRVGDDVEGPFDDDFWSAGCDVVLNALDNVEARLHVDATCVAHGLGLVDAGTLGPKGNVQAVVPGESESYGSSADPPEPAVPVCTLKNFPYEISHTIQWARDLFDGHFRRRPRQANDHVEEMAEAEDMGAFATELIAKLGDDAAVEMAEELGEDLGPFPFIVGNADVSDPEYLLAVKKVSLDWAIREAHRLFYVAMDELLRKHPEDSVDDDGAAFWSGTRRKPRPLRFIPLDSEEDEVSAQQVIINERIAQFVRSAARLRMETFLPLDGKDESSSISLDEALISLEEQAKLLYKKKKSKEILHNLSGGGGNDDATMSHVLEKLNGAKTGASFLPTLNLADFEKDDESNGHVAFVAAASNLRAMAYGIPPADAMETRRVAGRIVPAMITTTGLVSALSCLELIKMTRGLPLAMHKNAFVNLALPFFAFTAPVLAEEVEGVDGRTHTIWDRIDVKGSKSSPTGTMTLGKFLKKIRKKAGCGEDVEIASLSYGPFMMYANFLHGDDEGLLGTPLLDAVRDAVISEDDEDMALFEEDAEEDEGGEQKTNSVVNLTLEQKAMLTKLEQKRFIDFSVTVENTETGEEFELPPVRLIKDKERPHPVDNIEGISLVSDE